MTSGPSGIKVAHPRVKGKHNDIISNEMKVTDMVPLFVALSTALAYIYSQEPDT